MNRDEKLVAHFLSRKNITVDDCDKILTIYGYELHKKGGSHLVCHKKGAIPITVVTPKNTRYVNVAYVKLIIKYLKLEEYMKTTVERKPLEYYLGLKYPITLHASPEGGYAVEIEDLPGCISQGETVEEAIEMIEEARRLWMESTYEDGQEIPLPENEAEYSGKFNVRVPASLHRKLHRLAKKEGVSLNQYVVYALSHTAGVAESKPPYKK